MYFIQFNLKISRFSQGLPANAQLIAQHFQCQIITTELCLMLIQVFIVTLRFNPDRFFQRLNTVAANDPSTHFFSIQLPDYKISGDRFGQDNNENEDDGR
jgi:hypothetical protein